MQILTLLETRTCARNACQGGSSPCRGLPQGCVAGNQLQPGNPLARRPSARYDKKQSGFGGPREHSRQWQMAAPDAIRSADDSPLTRMSLLLQIRDNSNQGAWSEFMAIYGPMVYGFARKRGLQDADAADLMQDVMRSVSTAIGRLDYDRSQGTFRGWLFTITRNKVFNFLQSRRIRPQGSGDTTTNRMLDSHPESADESSESWEQDYQKRLAAVAMDRVKAEFQPNTWQAFWLTAVEGVPVAEVSKQVGLSAGAIYVAKSRVLARLKQEVEVIQKHEDG